MEGMFSNTRDLRFSSLADGAEGSGSLTNLTVARSAKERLKDLISEGIKPGRYLSSEYSPLRVRELPSSGGLATDQEDLPFEKMRTLREGTEGLLSRGLLDEEQVETMRKMAADEPVRCQVILEAFTELDKLLSERENILAKIDEISKRGVSGDDLESSLVREAKERLFEAGDIPAFKELRNAAEMIEYCDKVLGSALMKDYLRVEAIEALRKQSLAIRYSSVQDVVADITRVSGAFSRSGATSGFQRFSEAGFRNIDILNSNNTDIPKLLDGLATVSRGIGAALNKFDPELLGDPLTREQLKAASELVAGCTRISKRAEEIERTRSRRGAED